MTGEYTSVKLRDERNFYRARHRINARSYRNFRPPETRSRRNRPLSADPLFFLSLSGRKSTSSTEEELEEKKEEDGRLGPDRGH